MNKTTKTKTNPTIGKKIAKMEMMIAVPVSIVEIMELPNPAVAKVEVIRVAPTVLFMVAAVPPPAMIAIVQVIIGLKSATVETITAVPASVAKGRAMVSSKLSTNGI